MTQSSKIGFQGESGAHSQVAINSFFKTVKLPSQPQHPLFPRQQDNQFETVACPSFGAVFDRLQKKQIDYAFVPVENTASGTFTQLYDLLLKYHNQVFVVGEFVLHEENALIVNKDVAALEDIEEVYSHSHVLEQCSLIVNEISSKRTQLGKRKFFLTPTDCLAALNVYATDDSAASARFLTTKKHSALIGHASVAKLYGLSVLKQAVEDDPRSATRFMILKSTPLSNEELSFSSQMGVNKTSIAAISKNAPGNLFKALGCFAMRDLNITKIESRPSHRAYNYTSQSPWEYINYIDIEGGLSEERVRNALANLKEYANEVSIFGSYPRFSGSYASAEGLTSPYGG